MKQDVNAAKKIARDNALTFRLVYWTDSDGVPAGPGDVRVGLKTVDLLNFYPLVGGWDSSRITSEIASDGFTVTGVINQRSTDLDFEYAGELWQYNSTREMSFVGVKIGSEVYVLDSALKEVSTSNEKFCVRDYNEEAMEDYEEDCEAAQAA